jgi:hypothetical protein
VGVKGIFTLQGALPVTKTLIVLSAAMALATLAAQAQVRDAPYRGTLVCGVLPFAEDPVRAAIEVNLTANVGSYQRPVHAPTRQTIAGTETGTATVDGKRILLTGGWRGETNSYEAIYSGNFVRRSAKIAGTQIWTHGGKSYMRTCSGAIKRPFAVFLPKEKK